MLFDKDSPRHGPRPRPGGCHGVRRPPHALIFALVALCLPAAAAAAEGACNETVKAVAVTIEEGHAWRPPFGLDRVGRAITVGVEIEFDQRLLREYYLAGYVNGQETERKVLSIIRRTFGRKTSAEALHGGVAKAILETHPEEIALYSRCRFEGEDLELARKEVPLPPIQVEALARPAGLVNPVDLGTIFVPHDWLLLAPGRKTEVEAAANCLRTICSRRPTCRLVRVRRTGQGLGGFGSARQKALGSEADVGRCPPGQCK